MEVGDGLIPDSANTVRLRHTARGYSPSDVAITVEHHVIGSAPEPIYEAGVFARENDSEFLVAYVKGGFLYLDAMQDATLVNLATPVAITAMTADSHYWVRLICEGDLLRAEHWTSAPTPTGTAAGVVTHTLSGGYAEDFGAGVQGTMGIHWTPGTNFANARIDSFSSRPFTYRNRTLPDEILLSDIPGTLPARADLEITPSGGAAAPVYASLGWSAREAAQAIGVQGETTSSIADATALGGFHADVSSVRAWPIDPFLLGRDDFTEDVLLDVLARAKCSTADGRWVLSAAPLAADVPSPVETPAQPYGSQGKAARNDAAWHLVNLGSLRLPADGSDWEIRVLGTKAAMLIDYLWLLPSRHSAASPDGKTNDAYYPKFVPTTAEQIKTIRSDLRGLRAFPNKVAAREHGLGGAPIKLPPGDADVGVLLSSQVPDDVNALGSNQISHSATVHARIQPCYPLIRT